MKWYSYLLMPFVVSFFILAQSCTDLEEQFLDSSASKSAEFDAPSSGTLTAIVDELRNAFSGQENFYALSTHPTDELMGPTRGADWSDFGVWRTLHQHHFDPANKQIVDTWNTLHKAVVSCNSAIRGLSSGSAAQAQAITYRSFILFLLADLWGDIPFRTELAADFIEAPPVLKRTAVIDKAIKDLERVIEDLPVKDEAGYEYGLPTRDVGYAILAKLYLNKFVHDGADAPPTAEMDKVIEYADNIIGSGRYALATDYFVQNFGKDNHTSPESIFVVKITPAVTGNIRSRWRMTLHYHHEGTTSGWNGFTTLASFYDKFDKNDQRFKNTTTPIKALYGLDAGFLEGQQRHKDGTKIKDRSGNDLIYTTEVDLFYADEKQGVRVIKYLPENSNNDQPDNDIQIIRYADVLLMKAEALWRNGSNAEALTVLNQLRSARGVPALASIDGAALLNERGFELYWEGWRRNDQIRFGTWGDVWKFKPASPATAKLFPIPLNAIAANPDLKQNPGY